MASIDKKFNECLLDECKGEETAGYNAFDFLTNEETH